MMINLTKAKIEEINNMLKPFRSQVILHPVLNEIADKVLKSIYFRGSELVIVIGPTGVGKLALRKHILKRVKDTMGDPSPGCLSGIWVDVTPPIGGVFNWSEFFKHLLRELRDPLADSPKIVLPGDMELYGPLLNGAKGPVALMAATISALERRKPPVLIIDEAQGICDLKNEKTVAGQLNILKTMANRSKVPIVLLATYKLAQSLLLSGELVRRSDVLHLRPYNAEYAADVASFTSTLVSFQSTLPLKAGFDFTQKQKMLMTYSVGCVGLLAKWIDRALVEAISSGDSVLRVKHFSATAESKGEILTYSEEMKYGEDDLQEYYTGKKRKQDAKGSKRKKSNRRPGERNPVRDPVGGEGNNAGIELNSRN